LTGREPTLLIEEGISLVNVLNQAAIVIDRWTSCSKPNSHSSIRLFCFPYAGAGSSLFNVWSNFLLPEIELYLVNLPGRDARIREAPCQQLHSLIKPLTQGLLPHLDKPFVFFGHSMGSLISFEVVRELRRQRCAQPQHLFLSGRQAPPIPDCHPNLHHLPEEEFLTTTQKLYGSLPDIILQDRELVSLFLSMMRADITMIETYEYEQEAPLDCPITIYGGLEDPSVNEKDLAAWQDQTTADFKLRMFPGEHFFIQTARQALLQEMNAEFTQMQGGSIAERSE
jgi:medium-chain acyl-[acyl-carrier-protein] hydrolase